MCTTLSVKIIGIIFLFLSLTPSVFSFQATQLQAAIIDEKNSFIQDASVTLKHRDGLVKNIKFKSPTAVFSKLSTGKYWLEVKADGFKPYSQEIEIKSGINEITIKLAVAEIRESVEIKRDVQELATEQAFSNFLTTEQLEALPEDPEELERELRNQFGQDILIRVDGFPGRLPPKSQIASIKVTRNSFDAEYHQIGVTVIDVTTKSGIGKWNGSVSTSFNDESLNARHPFALRRVPIQLRRLDFFLSGPLIKDKSSLFISAFGNNSYSEQNILARLPNEQVNESVRSSINSLAPWIKFSQNLSKTHFLGITYQGRLSKLENSGVGGFNLAERAFISKISNHQLRISEAGNIGKRFFNEFRLQFTDETLKTIPISEKPTIIVLDAFSDGGAGNRNRSRKQGVWLADNFLFSVGKIHAMKIGGLFEYERRNVESAINQNGTFTFSSLDAYTLGKPAIFTQRLGIRNVKLSQYQIGAYIQDDIRLHRSFMLSAGLRYEWQNNLKDYNNFSPRIGFSWSPNKRGKTIFRGGAGVYYNWLETNSLANILSQDVTQPSETIIINPNYPNPFLSGISQILPQSFWQKAENLETPYIFLYSIGIEQRLNNTTSLRILYKYEKGVHQFRSRDINAPISELRPNLAFGRIVQVESSAFFKKNSLNIGLNGRLNRRISYGLEYTLARNISDNNGIFGLPSDNYNLQLDRSVADNDQRHKLYASVFWRIRKGLNLSTNFIAGSPLPYTITTGFDNNSDTVFNDRPFGISRNSERGTWQKQVDTSLSWTIGLIKRKAGETGLPGTIVVTSTEAASGDIGIDPAYKYSLKFYTTATNVLNQTNFTNFVGVKTSPFFRQPITADNPRRIQFGMRFSF